MRARRREQEYASGIYLLLSPFSAWFVPSWSGGEMRQVLKDAGTELFINIKKQK